MAGLRYGQHPRRAMPLRSWPTRGRVGGIIVIVTTPTKHLASGGPMVVDITPEARKIVAAREFEELTEFIQIVVVSEILE